MPTVTFLFLQSLAFLEGLPAWAVVAALFVIYVLGERAGLFSAVADFLLDRDKQEHEQSVERAELEARFRDELREDMGLQRQEIQTLTEEVRKMETWGRELVFALRHARWLKTRLFVRINDLREDCGKDPMAAETKAKFENPYYDDVLRNTPWGDMRFGRPVRSDHPPAPPQRPDSTSQDKTTT